MKATGPRAAIAPATALLAVLVACAGGGGGVDDPSSTPTAAPSTPPLGGQAPIFDQAVLHEARLDIDPAAWQALRDNYLSNQYYAANLTIDDVSVLQVGVRSRGEGSRNEEKPGLKVEFDKYVPAQEYYGFKSLVLDNLVQDPSMLRERLALLVFEAMGIPAPANAFARLSVNGQYWGLYSLVEPVSKPFLEERLGEKSGTLFDYEWRSPYFFNWLGPAPANYVPLPFEPETNEDRPDVADGLVVFIDTINGAPDASFVSAMESFLDVNRFLTHVAVENAIAERDGIVGDFGLNNFYLYQYGGQTRFVFIPWDKDSVFTAASWPLYRNLDRNVLTRRLTADPARRAVYTDAALRAVTSYVNPTWLTPRLDTAYQQIRLAAQSDVKKPYANSEFENAVGGLRTIIAAREADVRAQR